MKHAVYVTKKSTLPNFVRVKKESMHLIQKIKKRFWEQPQATLTNPERQKFRLMASKLSFELTWELMSRDNRIINPPEIKFSPKSRKCYSQVTQKLLYLESL